MSAEQFVSKFAKRARGRVRHEPGKMNKTEAAYAAHLANRKIAGALADFWFEPLKFRLADKTYYTPDFMVMLPDGLIEFHDVKGFMEDDAAVKIKVAAETRSEFAFFIVKRVAKTKGTWLVTRVGRREAA